MIVKYIINNTKSRDEQINKGLILFDLKLAAVFPHISMAGG